MKLICNNMDVPFFSAGDRPMVPSKTMAATMAAVKQQQMLIQQQKQRNAGQNGNGKSSDLPDFFTSKNDMGKCSFRLNINGMLKVAKIQ